MILVQTFFDSNVFCLCQSSAHSKYSSCIFSKGCLYAFSRRLMFSLCIGMMEAPTGLPFKSVVNLLSAMPLAVRLKQRHIPTVFLFIGFSLAS